MFAPNVTVTVDAVPYNYGLISIKDALSQRSNASAAIGEPDYLSISHQTKGKGSAAVDRHLVRLDTTFAEENADGSITNATATAYVVLVVPHSVVTIENIQLAYDKLAQFLSDTENGASETNFVRVINGEP